jgi:hypothetical protein
VSNAQLDPRNRQLDDSPAIARIQAALLLLTPAERVEAWRRFCSECGEDNGARSWPCQCWSDE